ncbi:MAG TPA: cytochrome C oxidase subunit IV family protein [Anaeromyxobacteraceae bacterium]|nr:cytochrome C oxidase subunit IV family protein [Anaeromyxobacteraceae bacterium]
MTDKDLLQQAASAAGHAPAARERGSYLAAFAVLVALTLVEIGVVRSGGIAHRAAVIALVAIAAAKAALIALFYMHLRYETRILKVTVLGPLLAPAVYGLVVMLDAAWRHLR